MPVCLDPPGSGLQWLGLQSARPPLRFAPAHNQPGALKHFATYEVGKGPAWVLALTLP